MWLSTFGMPKLFSFLFFFGNKKCYTYIVLLRKSGVFHLICLSYHCITWKQKSTKWTDASAAVPYVFVICAMLVQCFWGAIRRPKITEKLLTSLRLPSEIFPIHGNRRDGCPVSNDKNSPDDQIKIRRRTSRLRKPYGVHWYTPVWGVRVFLRNFTGFGSCV